MLTRGMVEQAPGLRERKKRQTREALTRAALELFAERGYDETTLADVADAAGVSTRTIFAYFPCKEDILFCTLQVTRDALAQALADRSPGTDALAALRSSSPPPSTRRARSTASSGRWSQPIPRFRATSGLASESSRRSLPPRLRTTSAWTG